MTASPNNLPHDWFPHSLPPNVFIGERSWCYSSFSCIHYRSQRPCGLRVGHDTGIYHGTFFDLGPNAEVHIGNYCTLVGPILATNQRILIHDFVFLAHEVLLADSPTALPAQTPAESARTAEPETVILLSENCWIGARAILLPGARIGPGAIVGAAAVVDFEVPPNAIVAGNPARIVGSATPNSSP